MNLILVAMIVLMVVIGMVLMFLHFDEFLP